MKNIFTLNEKEKKQIIEMHNNYKKLLNEQEVKQGGQGDPYQYKKEGDEYFYAMKTDGVNPNWKKHTTSKGREAICTRIFGRTPGCGSLADTNPKSNDSGPDVDSGVPASAQIAKEGVTPSSFGAKCTKITVIGSFPVRVTSNPANITKFMTNLINGIKTNEITNASYVKGKAVVSGIRLTGGASNRYGGKPVKPEMDNNYNFQNYPNNPAYDPNQFAKNKQLAVNRANGLYAELVKLLPSKGIALSPTLKPQVLSYVVDTGGKVDDTRNTGKYPNPGQIVIVEMDICGVEGTSSNTTKIPKSCINGMKIEYNYDAVVEVSDGGVNVHCCSRGLFNISLNGIPLTRTDGYGLANINNNIKNLGVQKKQKDNRPQNDAGYGSKRMPDGKVENVCLRKADNGKTVGPDYKLEKLDNYRYNTFMVNDELANQIIKSSKDTSGFFTLNVASNGDTHTSAARIQVYDPKGALYYDSCAGGSCGKQNVGDFKIPYCNTKG